MLKPKKVILDINGVILNNVDISIILHSFEKYGHLKTLYLLMCYKLNLGREYANQHLVPIAQKLAPKAVFLPGAEKALDALTQVPTLDIDICSNSGLGDGAIYLEFRYRDKSHGMRRISKYCLLPIDASKRNFYATASQGYAETLVVDDCIKNIKDAYELGLQPILITKNKIKAQFAKKKYNARCFPDLELFYRWINKSR